MLIQHIFIKCEGTQKIQMNMGKRLFWLHRMCELTISYMSTFSCCASGASICDGGDILQQGGPINKFLQGFKQLNRTRMEEYFMCPSQNGVLMRRRNPNGIVRTLNPERNIGHRKLNQRGRTLCGRSLSLLKNR